MKNKAAIQAKLRQQSFSGAMKKKSAKRKQKQVDADLKVKEEIWKKQRKQKKRNLYHKSPAKLRKTKQKKSKANLASVMGWGENVEGMNLDNMCTIENSLTIIHLFYQNHESLRNNRHIQYT